MWINLTVGECFRTLQGLQVEIQLISTDTARWLTAGPLAARMRAAHVCIFRYLGYGVHHRNSESATALNFNKEVCESKAPGVSLLFRTSWTGNLVASAAHLGFCYLYEVDRWLTVLCPNWSPASEHICIPSAFVSFSPSSEWVIYSWRSL